MSKNQLKGFVFIPTNYLEVSSIYEPAGITHTAQYFGREGNCKEWHIAKGERPCTKLKDCQEIYSYNNRSNKKISSLDEERQLLEQLKVQKQQREKQERWESQSYDDIGPIDGGMN
jgi:hypothetical protein